MTWNPLIRDYAIHQQASHFSPGTIRLHRYRLLDLAALHPEPAAITESHLVAILATTGWKPETRKSVRTTYRSFFRWARRTGRLPLDPAADLPAVRIPRVLPRPTPERVVRAGLRTADAREQKMIRLGAYGGLRCSEIALVHSGHWDGVGLLVTGKGGKQRYVPIVDRELCDELDKLDGYMFPNRWTGQPITAGHVSKLLSRALDETWTGHTLRHRFGTVALEGTKDLLAVGEVLGHSSTDTTRRYCFVSKDRILAVSAAAAA